MKIIKNHLKTKTLVSPYKAHVTLCVFLSSVTLNQFYSHVIWFYSFQHQSQLKSIFSYFQSVQFSRSVMSDSLRHHESQHARPPCPSPTPRVHSNSRPLNRWCHPAISSSIIPFSSCPQSLPASESVTDHGATEIKTTYFLRWWRWW